MLRRVDVFEDPPLPSHSDASVVLEAALRSGETPGDPHAVLVGLALADEDRPFVERWCQRIARHCDDPSLVATAALCLGHLARRFSVLDPDSVALVHRLARRTDLDGRTRDALDDVTHFLR